MEKKWLAGLAGLADPALINLARQISDKIPEDSRLRLQFVESVIGAARGYLEAHAEQFPLLASITTEKLTDVWKFMSAALANRPTLPLNNPRQQVVAAIYERLAQAEDQQKEAERIKTELRLIDEIMKMAHPQKEPSPVLTSLNKKLEELRDRLKKEKEATHGHHR